MISWLETRRLKIIVSALVALTVALSLSARIALAQDNYATPPPKFPSPIVKFNQLHQKIKQKFSGMRRETDSQPMEEQYQRQFLDDQHRVGNVAATPADFRAPPIQQAQYQQTLGHPTRSNGYAGAQHGRAPYPDPNRSNYTRVEPSRGAGAGREYSANPNRLRTTNTAIPSGQVHEHYDESYVEQPLLDYQTQSDGYPQFENVHPHSQYFVPGAVHSGGGPYHRVDANHSSGHFDYGSGVQRQSVNRTQETATQRVLKLESENELLRSAKESLIVENQRLRDLLKDNRQLLAEIQVAITVAQEELANANQRNGVLEDKIAQLEREQKAQQAETARLLDSIRNNLDDVLIREMTGK